MPTLRQATLDDLDFIVEVDLRGDGYSTGFYAEYTAEELKEHRHKMRGFLTERDKRAWIHEAGGKRVSLIAYSFRNKEQKMWDSDKVYDELDPALFPADGRFCEVFQLWVDPEFRRQGLATGLKNQMEQHARQNGIGMLYTHTEEANLHVIEMNLKLGYKEVRRGPIWDEVVRVSLVKVL